MNHQLSVCLFLVAYALGLAGGNSAIADSPSQANFRISTVAENGMPKDIVKKGARWNFGPGSLWTHRGWQYAAYWDDARQVSIARRELPSGAWSVVSLPGYQRTENVNRGKVGPKAQGFGDGHEKVAMGISSDGVIHLAFDHHGSTLHYRATKTGVANAPASHGWIADLFGPVQDNLGAGVIDFVTYPSFTVDGEHLSLYLRLSGGSGSADSHFMGYTNGRWTTADPTTGKLIDKNWSGGNRTVNAYPHRLVVRNGRRHLTWCWRDTPDARTCHDLCYAYSDDQGKTWLNNAGDPIGRTGSQFITAESSGVAAWKIPAGTSYVNGGSMTVDDTGRVHVLMRGETGKPDYFCRDPTSKTWTRSDSERLGELAVGPDDRLHVISADGVWRVSMEDPPRLQSLSSGHEQHFLDCKMGIDRNRIDHDGWVSVIGQTGQSVTVIDYRLGTKCSNEQNQDSNQPAGQDQ